MQKAPYLIGIAGGSGSGKTFLAQRLAKKLGASAQIILQDSYYHDHSQQFDHDGGSVNFDHPSAIDFKLLTKQLGQLKNGQNINMPQYDFKTHARVHSTLTTAPTEVIIVDGILIFTHPELRALFDKMVFVDTPEEIRFQRRLTRDVAERGRTPEGVRNQFYKQVVPMHNKFVGPSKQHADHLSCGMDLKKLDLLISQLVFQMQSHLLAYRADNGLAPLYQ